MFSVLQAIRAFTKNSGVAPRPLVLWDIDGPLNPFRAVGLADDERFVPHASSWNSGLFNVVEHPLWAGELLALGVEFLWVSNWAEEANEVGFALGLSEPIAHIPLEAGDGATWKLESVDEWLRVNAPGRPVLWVDDELGPDARAWAAARGNTLLVPVDAAHGWSRDQYESMVQWLTGLPRSG